MLYAVIMRFYLLLILTQNTAMEHLVTGNHCQDNSKLLWDFYSLFNNPAKNTEEILLGKASAPPKSSPFYWDGSEITINQLYHHKNNNRTISSCVCQIFVGLQKINLIIFPDSCAIKATNTQSDTIEVIQLRKQSFSRQNSHVGFLLICKGHQQFETTERISFIND